MIKYLITFIFFAFNSYGALEVTIAQGKVEPTPIAITQVFGEDADTSRYGNTIRQIISNNLTNSARYRLESLINCSAQPASRKLH
jgi:Tol biopolymer transport system component